MTEFVQALRTRRAHAVDGVWYGKKPNAVANKKITGFEWLLSAAILALIAWVVVFITAYVLQGTIVNTGNAEHIANESAKIVFFCVLLLPYLHLLLFAIRYWQWPNFKCWKSYTFTQKSIANIALVYLFVLGIDDSYAALVADHLITPIGLISTTSTPSDSYHHANALYQHQHNRHQTSITTPETKAIELNNTTAFGLLGILSLLLCFTTAFLQKNARPQSNIPRSVLDQKNSTCDIPFGLWLGESTGILSNRSHGVGMAAHQQVAIFGDDAAQNVLVLGATGSGKTTRAINPLLLQLLEQGCGGVVFDIKGDFHQTVKNLSLKINAPYTAVGVSEKPFNLLAGLAPEIAASFLKSAFLLNSGQSHDGFWIDTATELCRNVLGMLSFLPEHYSLHGLYSFLFDMSWRNQCYEDMDSLRANFDEKQQRLLKSYQHYYETIFSGFDEKVQSGVRATIAQVLAPFNHPELIDAFCITHPDNIRLEDVLDGHVFLINMPLARWGLGGKVVYTLIKLRFFNLMQNRAIHQEWNQERYVFFLCDEYQEIVSANKDGLSDLNFWDKSRSSKAIGIISTQSVSSFYAAIGDRDMANAILQNFRQKICFRTEDEMTIALLNRLLGTVEVQRVSNTQTSGSSSGGQYRSSHSSQSSSVSTHDKPLLDGQFFRTLPRDHALALLSLWGNGCDDVLKMEALFH